MPTGNRYPQEIRERAVRMVVEHRDEYPTEWAALACVAGKLGMTPETLRKWLRRDQVDSGGRPGVTTTERGRIRELEREVRELRRANEILKAASVFFAGGPAPPTVEAVSFTTPNKDPWGVEPICTVLPFAPTTYYAAISRPPSARTARDEELKPEIQRVWEAHRRVYGADKVWAQLKREGRPVARCTIERLMRKLGLRGVVRGKKVRTTWA